MPASRRRSASSSDDSATPRRKPNLDPRSDRHKPSRDRAADDPDDRRARDSRVSSGDERHHHHRDRRPSKRRSPSSSPGSLRRDRRSNGDSHRRRHSDHRSSASDSDDRRKRKLSPTRRDRNSHGHRDAEKRKEEEEVLPPPPPPPMPDSAATLIRTEERRSSSPSSDSDSRRRHRKSNSDRRRHRHSNKHISGSGSESDDRRKRKRSPTRRGRNGHRDVKESKHTGSGKVKRKEEEEVLPPPPPLPPMPDAAATAGRTGGIYIPPFRMAQMMREVQDKSSDAYQRLSWDALRKSINGLVNKVNATNIKNIIPELLSENLIRGRGLFCRSCMKSQMASPGFTDVFAALVAVVNTKFPDIGKLLLKRIVLQLKRAYKRNDKPQLLAATKFIAHLVNQQVAHEIVALELLTLLLEKPTDDSVEVAVGFVKECGAILQDLSPQGLYGIFERFRGILHEAELDKRVRYLIEDLFGIRRAKFEGYPAVRPELDLVEQEDQFIHEISLEDDDIDPETNLDVFKSNPQFMDDEKAYEDLKRNILGAESSEDEDSEADSLDEGEEESEEDDEEKMEIKDETETNLVNLRRTIYLTIMSSVDFEEAGHKLLKIKLEPGQEMELCIMMLECCSQERTYLRYYGLLGQRFCTINRVYQENFETCFVQQYSMIHRLETNKLRNVAKFFAHLLGTSALPWNVLSYIRLTEDDTTSSSRIFIKILFQELSEHLGIRLLNERLNDPTMQESFESIFPKDNPKNTRFSINFFTSIGLGGITESLREYLKIMPRLIMQQQKAVADSDGESGSSGSSDSSSGSDTESDSGSESSSDESERNKKSRKKRRK